MTRKDHAYETYVRGVWVPFSPDVIGHFYGVPEGSDAPNITNWNAVARAIYPIEHPRPWPQSNVVRHGDMSDELRLLHSFMASNNIPTTHLTEIFLVKMTTPYRLATGHRFNFGEHIFNIIMDLASHPKCRSKLIFPGLISALCKRAHVPMHSSEKDKAKTLILPPSVCATLDRTKDSSPGWAQFGPVLDSIQDTLRGHTGELQCLQDGQDALVATLHAMGERQRNDHHELLAMFKSLNPANFPSPSSRYFPDSGYFAALSQQTKSG
ncbi:Envelope-like protein [Abeliophyllum distichum]|uniref:Envelope-like protein n=1 Tax=Abeliophyllum distichum TaxID=126358 RepID=A0ABD1SE10_9LAMI